MDGHLFVALEPKGFPARAGLEGERQDAHADEVRTVNALEGFGDDRADPKQFGALGRPVARGAVAIFGAGEDDQRNAFRLIFHRRVEDRHFLAVRPMFG